eukprot:TRINITY_DN3903_c0_g1_i13.p2 TRINITY_DN3903_c0_g1~~TRINITY_DN3903_c0_g1_i13.p2  ORF type:complete len:132 (-),score=21.63 TRINITY_DN3903_c0_g1_i13:149-544(-)
MTEYEVRDVNDDDCGICMMKMKTALRLYCGHYYHSACILKMLTNNKTSCPVCKSPFDHYDGSSSQLSGGNVLRSLVRGMISPIFPRRTRVSNRDIEEVARLFPNVSRWEIEAEILAAGSVEQAIGNISEWI